MKERKLYIGNELLGVEKRASPLLVDEKRASHMKNLLCVDGVNTKRKGWRQLYHFRDENDRNLKINGIYEYKGKEIIHAGGYLYEGGNRINGAIILSDTKSCGFENNGLLYIVCGGELLIYNGSELTYAYEGDYVYIPLTCSDISPIGYESTAIECESANLLTAKRRNTLIGVRSERARYKLDGRLDTEKPIEVKTRMLVKLGSTDSNVAPYNAIYKEASRLLSDNIEGIMGLSDDEEIYKLFSGEGIDKNFAAVEEIAVFLNKPVKVESAIFEAREGFNIPRMSFHLGNDAVLDTGEVTYSEDLDLTDTLFGQAIDAIYFYGNDENGTINKVSILGRQSYEGEIEIIHRVERAGYNESIAPLSIKDTGGRELTLSKNLTGSQSQGATAWLEEGISPNEAILGFSFCNVSPTPNKSNIEITYSAGDGEALSCSIGEVCKSNTGSGILALADGNTVYLSCGIGGFGYFPSSLKKSIGNYGNITALCAMSDFSIGVFKENEAYYFLPTVKENKTELTLKGYSSQGGSLSHFATKTVNLDTLSPQKDNIYGSIGADTQGRVRRGSNIALDLKKHNLEHSIATEYNGCYYLFVDGCAYVADTRYKNYENNRLDSSFEYEWWYLDNIPTSYVAKINGELHIGREDGRVACFYDGYCDVYYEKIDTGSYFLDENEFGNTVIYLNEELVPCDYDRVLVSSAYSCLGDIVAQGEADGYVKIVLSSADFSADAAPVRIYPNMKLYLQGDSGELVAATVKSVDALEYSLTLDLEANSDTYASILHKNEGDRYTLKQEDDHFILLDVYNMPTKLCLTDSICLECERRKPVAAEYVSAAILEDSYNLKTLYQIVIDLLGSSEGMVTVGYETDKALYSSSYEMCGSFDFDSIDFGKLSFNASLKKSHLIRCFERGFGYLVLKIQHSEDKAFSLKGYQITYTNN